MHTVKQKNNLFYLLLFFLFIAQSTFSTLERYIFSNELFVFAGIALLIFNFNYILEAVKKDYLKGFYLIHLFFILLLWGFFEIIYSILFLKTTTNVYVFFRTTVIWYSMFSFFLGLKFYNLFVLFFFKKVKSKKKWLITLFNAFSSDRYNLALLPLIHNKTNRVIFIIVLLLLVFIKGEDTPKVIFIATIFLYLFNKKNKFYSWLFNPILLFTLFILSLISLLYLSNKFSLFFDLDIADAYQYIDVIPSAGVGNIIWRIMFWAYELKTVTLSSVNGFVFGFGFGTPIFDINAAPSFLLISNDTPNEEYYLGTHNSILYILFKQGIIAFVLFLSIIFSVFNRLKKINKQNGYLPNDLIYFFLSFIFIFIAALFNVVLESALYASVFWIHIGMLYQAISKYELLNLQK